MASIKDDSEDGENGMKKAEEKESVSFTNRTR